MTKTKYLIIISIFIFLPLFFLSNSYQEGNIESYYYVTALGIDKSPNNNLLLSVQIAKPTSSSSSSSGSSAQSSGSILYSVECTSINFGISIFNNYLSKKLNLSHCTAIIFSEELAKEGINDYISTLIHNTEIRPNCNIIVCNQTAKEGLEKISNSEENISARLYKFIVNSVEYTSYSINPEITEFFNNISDDGYGIATYGKISENTLQNDGIAVFKKDKYLTKLNVIDSICYSIIENTLKNCILTIQNPFIEEKELDVQVKLKNNSEISVNLVNGTPYIKLNVSIETALANTYFNFDYTSKENIEILEKATSKYLEELLLNYLYKISHNLNTDICGFKNKLANNFLTLEDFNKINWNDIFQYSFFEVNVQNTLNYNGLFIKD